MDVALGVDVGGTKILGVAVSRDGDVLEELPPVPSPNSPRQLLDSLEAAVRALIESARLRSDEVVGIGVGVPGLIDSNGVLNETANLPAVQGTPVRAELSRRLAPVIGDWSRTKLVIDNDGTCSAAGEWKFGAARDLSDVVVVALGTGIGGGLIAGGRLLHGGRGFAGEIGHMVIEVDGPICVCGRRGCWEQFVSGSGHARLAREAASKGRATEITRLAGGDPNAIKSKHVFLGARAGDLEAWGIVDIVAKYLAVGFANLVEILDPLAIIVAGGVINDADIFIPLTREYFEQTRRGSGERAVEIRVAELGERAGAVGAAALGLEELS
ncbi:MAG TPA: ROK family protein [Acidimicrobiales bacterium]|nr:ROK family protein [Acidimicrobiales bacterium]